MFRRRRLIPNLEHFTRNVPTVQPILLAISAMLSPCSRKVGISLKAARGTFRPICILKRPNFRMPLVSHNRTALFVRVGATQGLFHFGRTATPRMVWIVLKKLVQQTAIDFRETEFISGACPPVRLRQDIG